MQLYTGIFLDSLGNPKPSAQLKVLLNGTATLANLFDESLSPIGNPVTADAEGRFKFRTASGQYDFRDTSDALVLLQVQIFDLANPQEWLLASQIPTVLPLGDTVQEELENVNTLIASLLAPIIGEVPAGVKDGVNTLFTLSQTPVAGTAIVYINGVRSVPVVSGPVEGQHVIVGPQITLSRGLFSVETIIVDYRQ